MMYHFIYIFVRTLLPASTCNSAVSCWYQSPGVAAAADSDEPVLYSTVMALEVLVVGANAYSADIPDLGARRFVTRQQLKTSRPGRDLIRYADSVITETSVRNSRTIRMTQ